MEIERFRKIRRKEDEEKKVEEILSIQKNRDLLDSKDFSSFKGYLRNGILQDMINRGLRKN